MAALNHNYVIPQKAQDDWAPILTTPGCRRRLRAKRMNKGQALYPGIISDNRDTLEYLRELSVRLTEELKSTVDKATGAVGSDGVAGDFFALNTVAGHGMNPISVPPVDNQLIREKLGLVSGFKNPRHERIAKDLMKCMFGRAAPAKVSIRRAASTGAPDFVSDVDKKKTELRAALSNIDHYLDLVDKSDLLELFLEYNSPIVHTTGERNQADSVIWNNGKPTSKPREVNDELAARTGLREGRRFDADKRVIVNGETIEGHFATRRRSVFGTSFVPNYVLATYCSSWRQVYFVDYEFTWKHRTPESILGKITRFHSLVGFDVKQFDQSVGAWLINWFCDTLADFVDPRVAKLVHLLFHAPYMVPYPWVYEDGHEGAPFNPLFGNPFDIGTFTMDVGLPSGIAINPDFGKFAMVFAYLCVVDDYMHNVLEITVDRFLKGEHPTAGMLNAGDDCVMMSNDEGFTNHCRTAGTELSPYFHVEMETPIKFLGNVPYVKMNGEFGIAPDIVSYFTNWWVPEHGVDHTSRLNTWAIGNRERRVHYAAAPSFDKAFTIESELFGKYFGRTITSFVSEHYEEQRQFASMSTIDALVLQNPGYLHYRYDEDQVSSNILELIVSSIPKDEAWDYIKGTIPKANQELYYG